MYFKIYGFVYKTAPFSFSGELFQKPFCYEDVHRTTYKATSLYLRFQACWTPGGRPVLSERTKSPDCVWDRWAARSFPFSLTWKVQSVLSSSPPSAPTCPVRSAELHWVGRAHRGLSQSRPRLQGRLTLPGGQAQPGLTDPPRYSGPRVLQAGLLQNLRSCCLTSGLLQKLRYYSLPQIPATTGTLDFMWPHPAYLSYPFYYLDSWRPFPDLLTVHSHQTDQPEFLPS